MGLATFKGGIHPYEGKELSENKPIQVLLPKGELVLSYVSAHRCTCKATGSKGRQGSCWTEDRRSRRIYFCKCDLLLYPVLLRPSNQDVWLTGAMVPSIIVENDGEYETVEGVGEDRDPSDTV